MGECNFVDYEVRAADISEGQHGDPLGRIFQVLRRCLDFEATWIGFDNTIENVFWPCDSAAHSRIERYGNGPLDANAMAPMLAKPAPIDYCGCARACHLSHPLGLDTSATAP
jgi:hypothetical protein